MKISVIIPVYNCADYVGRCVHSIMAQTYTDLEIICIDDGSNDKSGEILDNLKKLDSRICVVHQKNAGVSATRNAGIDMATGDWITFVDADDAIEPDMYETLLSQVIDETIDIVHCGYKRIHLDGTEKEVNGTGKVLRQNSDEAAKCLLLGTVFVGSLCNKIYKSTLFEKIRLDTSLAINEDILANAELIKLANQIVYYDVGKYLMYERTGSATSSAKQIKSLTDCVNAAEKMYQLYKGTSVEAYAAKRLYLTLVRLYRWYVFSKARDSHLIRKDLNSRIEEVLTKGCEITAFEKLNYIFIKYFPSLYKFVYKIYDKIRVPDWDV